MSQTRRGSQLDDSRETTTANASTRPQRHFSQIRFRIESDQLGGANSLAAPADDDGVADSETSFAPVEGDEAIGVGGVGPEGDVGVDADEADEDVGDFLEVGWEESGEPRSFWPMFGTSRGEGTQNYRGKRKNKGQTTPPAQRVLL